jgi:hypothetical protein
MLMLLVSLFLLFGCSGTYNTYYGMLKTAFTPVKDVQFTYAQLNAAPMDYLYVRFGDLPQAALALAYIEGSQFKWVSGDRVLLVTDNGRIVRTSGLPNDLLYLTNAVSDPLKQPFRFSANSSWLRLADWSRGEYGYQIRSTFEVMPVEQLMFFGHSLAVIPVIESLRYENESNFVRFDGKWQNQYWLDAQSGEVLKSRQVLAPGNPAFEMVFISAAARKLTRAGVTVSGDAL